MNGQNSEKLQAKKLAQLQRLAIAPTQIQDKQIILQREQQHYLGRVLRLRQGDRFIAMDGRGQWWLAQLCEGEETAEIVQSIAIHTELPIEITAIVGLPKNGFDEIVRQITELGVTTIVPAIADRSLLKPSPQKLERWRRIAREAAEQSERQIVPTIVNPISFRNYLTQSETAAFDRENRRYIAVARTDAPSLLDCLLNPATETRDFADQTIEIATGPEGGWTPEEVEAAIAAGFQPISLGSRILRAITAPVVALSAIAAVLEATNKPK